MRRPETKKVLVIFGRIVYKHSRLKNIRAAAGGSLCKRGIRCINRHFHALSPIKEYKT
jgi:hypothetical protein